MNSRRFQPTEPKHDGKSTPKGLTDTSPARANLKKKRFAAVALALLALAMLFAIGSFLRENWAANQSPGAIESFIARLIRGLGAQRRADQPNLSKPLRKIWKKAACSTNSNASSATGWTASARLPKASSFTRPSLRSLSLTSNYPTARCTSSPPTASVTPAMPAFSNVLTPEEAWKTVLWVRRLAQQPPAPACRTSIHHPLTARNAPLRRVIPRKRSDEGSALRFSSSHPFPPRLTLPSRSVYIFLSFLNPEPA